MTIALNQNAPFELKDVALHGGRPGIGLCQILFLARYMTWPADAPEALHRQQIISGRVAACAAAGGKTPVHIGRLQVEGRPLLVQYEKPAPRTQDVLLVLDLDHQRLASLERIRAGGGLSFQVVIEGRISLGAEFDIGEDQRVFSVNQSAWAQVLHDARYRTTLLLEVPVVAAEVDEHLAAAGVRLAEARELLLVGKNRQAVRTCRDALEALGETLGDGTGTKTDLKAMVDHPDTLDKDQRLMVLRRAAFTMACLASHAKGSASSASWDSCDARGMVTLTASLIQWIAELRQEPK